MRHPKYGDGIVFRREGDGEDAKITVQFSKFGVKKLVEKVRPAGKALKPAPAEALIYFSAICVAETKLRAWASNSGRDDCPPPPVDFSKAS